MESSSTSSCDSWEGGGGGDNNNSSSCDIPSGHNNKAVFRLWDASVNYLGCKAKEVISSPNSSKAKR